MRILIVDDHPIVRAGLRRLLGGERDYEVREAAGGREALAAVREWRPALVVLDLSMPGIGGLEVISRLRLQEPSIRILVLSMHTEAIYATRALQAGAAGFIGKSAPPDRLLDAVKRLAAGQNYIDHEIAQELALTAVHAPGGKSGLPLQDLSPREFEILRLLGDGSSLQQIADAIGISYKTAANCCGQLKAKLRVARTADLVRIAVQNGIAGR
ncbi:MAG TPA: response regulator transcription factor [Stellaceae bacterium]|nr:response regulator transcription factor [Stellaceae bacterium]